MVRQSAEYAGQSIYGAFHALLHQLFVHPKLLRRIIIVNPLKQDTDNAKERQQGHQGLQQKGGDIVMQAFADMDALQVQLLEDGLSQKQDAQNAHHHRSGFRIDQPLPVSELLHGRRTVA